MKQKSVLCVVYRSNGVPCFAARFSDDDLRDFEEIILKVGTGVSVSADNADSALAFITDADRHRVQEEAEKRGVSFIHGL